MSNWPLNYSIELKACNTVMSTVCSFDLYDLLKRSKSATLVSRMNRDELGSDVIHSIVHNLLWQVRHTRFFSKSQQTVSESSNNQPYSCAGHKRRQ